MYTFNKMWGVVTPSEAQAKIEEQKKQAGITEPKNLEEQAISLVGTDIYEKLIKGYTMKQWGRPCDKLPSFIIKRLPVRLTFDNNYFNALYQGIPVGGYTKMVENMLEGIDVKLGVDYFDNKSEYDAMASKVVYTGAIDAYFDYKLGTLEYRSVRFENESLIFLIFREMQQLIILILKHLGLVLLNISGSSSERMKKVMTCLRLLFQESTVLNGSREMNLTIL